MNAPYTIVVQYIHTSWRKEQRGGVNAALRNSVPDVLGIPLSPKIATEPIYLIHEVEYSRLNFEQPDKTWIGAYSADRIFSYRDFFIQPDDALIKVVFPFKVVFPDKKKSPSLQHYYFDPETKAVFGQQGVLTVRPDQWVQFLYNARYRNFPDEGNRTWYEKWVVNIGLFLELTPTVFIEREPAHVINRLKQIR